MVILLLYTQNEHETITKLSLLCCNRMLSHGVASVRSWSYIVSLGKDVSKLPFYSSFVVVTTCSGQKMICQRNACGYNG